MEMVDSAAQVEALTDQPSTCTVMLKVPKLVDATQSHNASEDWGRCLHHAYEGGWIIIGDEVSNSPKAIGKTVRFIKEVGVVRIPLYFLLVQQQNTPGKWLRGALDETITEHIPGTDNKVIRPVINLDDRASMPITTTGRPCGRLGHWPIKFVHRNSGGWQYREMCQIINVANQSLPADHAICLGNEQCLDPQRLWMPELSLVKFDIHGAI